MKEMGISDVLAQMRALKAQAQQGANVQLDKASSAADFGQMLAQQVNQVNAVMQEATKLSDDFVGGKGGVNEVQVMVALQKSTVAYQALNQVRNKLLLAYQEIMNMSV